MQQQLYPNCIFSSWSQYTYVTVNQNIDDLKYFVFQIYVLPPIDKIPESHPHAEKINRLVAEEKSKLKDVSDVLSKTDLATRCIQPEDLESQHSRVTDRKSIQMKHLTAKESVSTYQENPGADSGIEIACSHMIDLGPGGKAQHPENPSMNTPIQDGGLEEQQQISKIKSGGNFIPLDGGVSCPFNTNVKIQTCSQCHRLLCRETLKKGSLENIKAICEKCMSNSLTSESSTTEKVVTLYRCGICFMDFFEKDALATHMDEKHKVSAETVFDTVTKNFADIVSNTHTAVTSQRQGPSMSTNMEMLCPPENLLLQNIVLQLRPSVETLPLTFTNPNLLVNPAPVFTLQPSNVPGVLTSPQTSTVVAPKNLMSTPKLFLQPSAEVLADTGRVLLLEQPVPKVAIPKLNSMNKAASDSSALLEDSPIQKTEVRSSNNESPK